MESIAPASSFITALHRGFGSHSRFSVNRHNSHFLLANGYPCLLPLSQNRLRTSVIVARKKNPNYNKKPDKHSFVSKPNESTGPFPEAVLLKQKKVQEDGRLLPDFADAEEKKLYDSLNLELESGVAVDQMRHYEVVYLIHEDYVDEVESVNLKIQDFLREKRGIVWRFSDWGVRRLAYSIKKADFAHYILMNFELGAKWINEFKSLLDKDERVIRHLVIKMDEAVTEDCPPPPEFHTLRAGTDDEDDDEEYEDEDDEEYEDEDDDEDYEDEDEDEDEEYEDEDDDDDEEYEDEEDDEEYEDGDDEEYDDEEYEDEDVEDEEKDGIIYVDDDDNGDESRRITKKVLTNGRPENILTDERSKKVLTNGRRNSRTDTT